MTYTFTRKQWLNALAGIPAPLLEAKGINFQDLITFAVFWSETRAMPGQVSTLARIPWSPYGNQIWAFLKNQEFITDGEPTLPDRVVF